jgi:hypothetical protein
MVQQRREFDHDAVVAEQIEQGFEKRRLAVRPAAVAEEQDML